MKYHVIRRVQASVNDLEYILVGYVLNYDDELYIKTKDLPLLSLRFLIPEIELIDLADLFLINNGIRFGLSKPSNIETGTRTQIP